MILQSALRRKTLIFILAFLSRALIHPGVLSSPIDIVCGPDACLNGSMIQISAGAVLEGSPTSIALAPGNYSRFHDGLVHSNTGFSIDQQAGLRITQSSPLILYPRPYYRGEPQLIGANFSNFSGTFDSFLLMKGYQVTFGNDGVTRLAVHDSSPNMNQWKGLKDLALMSFESSSCPNGCGAGGSCTQPGSCVCNPGFTGARCDSCANGYFGPYCRPCPNCESAGSACDDGTTGTGTCILLDFNKTQNLLPISQSRCNCSNGVCTSQTSCLCSAGWTTAPNGTLCGSCMTGFFLNALGECTACSPGCEACVSPSGICQSCVKGFQVLKDNPTICVPSPINLIGGAPTSCNEGFYNSENSTCSPCDPSCKACFGSSSGSCTQCFSTKALFSAGNTQNNSLSSSCVDVDSSTGLCLSPPPGLFLFNQTKGLCDPAPRLCSAASLPGFSLIHPVSTSIDSAVCSSCVADALLLPSRPGALEGRCVGLCPNGTYDDRHGHCNICPAGCSTCKMSVDGVQPLCTTCSSPDMFLSEGKCIPACPPKTFASLAPHDTPQASQEIKVCLPCSASCGNCTQSPTACQSCPSDRPAFNAATQTCSLACQKGTFADSNSDGQCSPCHLSCETCAGPDSSDCLSCKPTDKLKDGRCQASACAKNATHQIPDWNLCLEDLLVSDYKDESKEELPTWLLVLVVLLLSFMLAALCLFFWRVCQRKKRQEKTKQFGNELTTADVKLYPLEGPFVPQRHQPDWNDDTISAVFTLRPPPLTPTGEFKIKRKLVPINAGIDDWERESMSMYSQSDYNARPTRPTSIPELPIVPISLRSEDTTTENALELWKMAQGSSWLENNRARRSGQQAPNMSSECMK